MNYRSGFPIVVGVYATGHVVSEKVFSSLQSTLKKIRERSAHGALAVAFDDSSGSRIAEAAARAGISFQPFEHRTHDETTHHQNRHLPSHLLELIETTDIVVIISTTRAAEDGNDGVEGYARGLGRPVIRIDSHTGAVKGEVPDQFVPDHGWLPELFEMAGLPPDADLDTIKSKMSALANKTAPLTRSKWNWIVFLQGLAVCMPLGWLIGFPVRFVGLAAFGSTLGLVGLHFWLRWKSMQKTWAQARLVAETARSLIATTGQPEASPWHTLSAVHALRPLRWARRRPAREQSFAQWLKNYIKDRVAIQQKYFADKRKEAEQQRKKLTSWTSLLLDLALFSALVGLVLVVTPAGYEWMVGGALSARALGSFSILVLLGLLLVQIARELHELNRRTARFAQQELVLSDAIRRLRRIQSDDLALDVVRDTESKLFAEVLEWYFHAETAERFVELRERARRTLPRDFLQDEGAARRFARSIPGAAGTAGLIVLRAILGRLPFVVIPTAIVVVWIFYHLPNAGENVGQLEKAVRLLGPDDDDKHPFGPGDHRQGFGKHGYVVLAHGLWGRGILTGEEREDQRNWMKPCADAITKQLADKGLPEICLVDWSKAARPSDFYNRVFGERSFLADVPAIRAQAYRVGDIAAVKLAGAILSNDLPRRNVPVHLIGHSAGGFVVTRIARRLAELGLVDRSMVHVTILDTPAPDKELTEDVPDLYLKDAVDFYISSDLGGKLETLRSAPFSANVYVHPLPPETETSQNAEAIFFRPFGYIKALLARVGNWGVAHRYSYTWYQWTIECPKEYPGEGFNRSHWLREAQLTGRY